MITLNEIKDLGDAWLKISQLDNNSEEYKRGFWAVEKMFELTEEQQEDAWEVINYIRHKTKEEKALALLAAGHFEDLLKLHGNRFIDRIESIEKTDINFRYLLAGIWRTENMSDELWQRLEKVASLPKS